MPKPVIKTLQFSAIVVLLFLAWVAMGWARADLLIREVRQDLTAWQSSGGDLETLQEWESTRDKLEQAISLRPKEPEYHRLRGYLYEWRFRAPITDDNSILTAEEYTAYYQDTLEEILISYRQSIALRPVWPNAWVQLARVKGDFKQHDEEFSTAVKQTIRYGKNVPRMQLEVNQLAVRNFAFILQDPVLFPLIKENTQRSFTNNAGLVRQNINYFNATNMLAFACAWVDTSTVSAVAQRACRQFQPAQ